MVMNHLFIGYIYIIPIQNPIQNGDESHSKWGMTWETFELSDPFDRRGTPTRLDRSQLCLLDFGGALFFVHKRVGKPWEYEI